jgi:hypothetical protein
MTIQEFAPILKVLLDAQNDLNDSAFMQANNKQQVVMSVSDYDADRADLVGELIYKVIHAVTQEEAA